MKPDIITVNNEIPTPVYTGWHCSTEREAMEDLHSGVVTARTRSRFYRLRSWPHSYDNLRIAEALATEIRSRGLVAYVSGGGFVDLREEVTEELFMAAITTGDASTDYPTDEET